jgi:uncharacterized protein YkwD
MKLLNIMLIVLVMGFTSSCKKSSNPETIENEIVYNTNVNNDLMLKLVNDIRATGCNCGLTAMPPVPKLTWNNLLANAAVSHSRDMATKNILNHDSSDGKNTGQRLTSFGYKWTTYAENIAEGQTTEQEVFNDWLKSEGHCKNIMNASVTEMGVARSGRFWTQDFGKR